MVESLVKSKQIDMKISRAVVRDIRQELSICLPVGGIPRQISPSVPHQESRCQLIAFQSEAAYRTAALRGYMGDPPEFLTGMDIRNMHFNDRTPDRGNGIADGHGRMSVSPGIQDDAIGGEALALQGVDDLPFYVTLKVDEIHIGKGRPQLGQVCLETEFAVDMGFPLAEQVQIGAVDDDDLHDASCRTPEKRVRRLIVNNMQIREIFRQCVRAGENSC